MRFVKVEYTGKTTDGLIVETTSEKVAKDNDIYDKHRIYSARPIVTGENMLLKGLDDEIEKMKAGEEKTAKLRPNDAFGDRMADLVKLVPLREFKKQNVNPVPGAVFEVEGRPARIQSVAGGRVRVDFNHPLAGKELEYKVKVTEEAKTKNEKIKYLLERNFLQEVEFKADKETLAVTISEKLRRHRAIYAMKAGFFAEANKYLQINEIDFIENWKNNKDLKA